MLLVVLLGLMVGLAWFLPDDKTRDTTQDSYLHEE
jgi:hypothetical protein